MQQNALRLAVGPRLAALLLWNLALGAQMNPGIGGGSISLSRLQHKVPPKAQKAYFSAQAAWERNDPSTAARKLESAIALDPRFFEAVNNLGVMYLRLEMLQEAIAMFERAIQIDGANSQAEANLAYTLLALHRNAEAEAAARASLRGDGSSSRAHIFLAVSLLEQGKRREEAILHLKIASAEFQEARDLLRLAER